MAEILEKTYWIVNEDGVPVLNLPALSRMSDVTGAINASLDYPFRLSATNYAADSRLHIRGNYTPAGDGSAKSCGPTSNVVPSFVDTTIDFQTQAIVGGTVSISWPASTVGKFRRCAFSIDNTGTLIASFSAEVVSVGSLANPGTLFVNGALPVGWVDLQCTNVTGRFKTANSSTSIIENAVSGTPTIYNIAAGGGGGTSGASAGFSQEVALGSGVSSFTITFPTPLINTRYVPQIQIQNYTDANPQFLQAVITNKTINGFDVILNAPTDSANYVADYVLPGVQEQLGEAPVPLGNTSITVTFPIPLGGTNYSVIGQLVNYTDPTPQFQPTIITQKTTTTFTAKWSDPTDTANYLFAYHVAEWV